MSRASEEFREQLRKDLDYDDMRLLSPDTLSRMGDTDRINKYRQDVFKQQSNGIRKLTERSGDYDDMEKARSSKGDYKVDEREFALQDNVAVIYYNFYGENFEGGEIIDNAEDGYTCPFCHVKYGMSLKSLPDNCLRCGHITPLGRLKRDDAFRR